MRKIDMFVFGALAGILLAVFLLLSNLMIDFQPGKSETSNLDISLFCLAFTSLGVFFWHQIVSSNRKLSKLRMIFRYFILGILTGFSIWFSFGCFIFSFATRDVVGYGLIFLSVLVLWWITLPKMKRILSSNMTFILVSFFLFNFFACGFKSKVSLGKLESENPLAEVENYVYYATGEHTNEDVMVDIQKFDLAILGSNTGPVGNKITLKCCQETRLAKLMEDM